MTNRAERIAFLRRAKALLNSDGILTAAYLNAWGVAKTMLTDSPAWFEGADVLQVLQNGEAFCGAYAFSGFTECHWSNPNIARAELDEAGLRSVKEIGAEGFAAGARREIEAIWANDPALFGRITTLAVKTSALPQYWHTTGHLLFATKAA
jgi:hypothetical protein